MKRILWLAILLPLTLIAADPADLVVLQTDAIGPCDMNLNASCAMTRIILDHEVRIVDHDDSIVDHESRLAALEAEPAGFQLPAECAPSGAETTGFRAGFIKILRDNENRWMPLSEVRWWFTQENDDRVFVNIEGFARVVAVISGDPDECLPLLLDAIELVR